MVQRPRPRLRMVAFLYDRGCVPSYTVAMIEFDEPPWDRFIDKPWGRFICPGCGQTLDMHVSHGPGTPGTVRFREVAQAAHGSSDTNGTGMSHGFAVSDGDTVKFGRQRVRLFGIDALR